MRNYFFLGLSLTLMIPVQAQDLQLLIGDEVAGQALAYQSIELSDGSLLLHYDDGSEGSLLRTDASGSPLWRIAIDHALFSVTQMIAGLNGSSYILAGSEGAAERRFLVAKLDPDGNSTWSRIYQVQGNVYSLTNGATGILRSDGGLDLAMIPSNCFTCGEFYVLRIAPDGTPGLAYTLESCPELTSSPVSIGHDLQGRMLFHHPLNMTMFPVSWSGLVAVFDASGQPQWSRILDLNNNGGSSWVTLGSSLAVSADGSSYVFGDQQIYGEDVHRAFLLKLNANGSLGFLRYYESDAPLQASYGSGSVVGGTVSFGNMRRISFDLDGVFLGARDLVQTISHSSGNFEMVTQFGVNGSASDNMILAGSMVRTDTDGGTLYSTPVIMNATGDEWTGCLFSSEGHELATGAQVSVDLDILMGGNYWISYPVFSVDSIFLGAYLSLPEISPLCTTLGYAVSDPQNSQMRLLPTQVPQGMSAQLQLPIKGGYELRDAQGRSIQEPTGIAEGHQISTAGLSAGIYLVRAFDITGRPQGVLRLVVE